MDGWKMVRLREWKEEMEDEKKIRKYGMIWERKDEEEEEEDVRDERCVVKMR